MRLSQRKKCDFDGEKNANRKKCDFYRKNAIFTEKNAFSSPQKKKCNIHRKNQKKNLKNDSYVFFYIF